MVEYCSLHRPKASPLDQPVERPKKGAVEDDLSSFHRDICNCFFAVDLFTVGSEVRFLIISCQIPS